MQWRFEINWLIDGDYVLSRLCSHDELFNFPDLWVGLHDLGNRCTFVELTLVKQWVVYSVIYYFLDFFVLPLNLLQLQVLIAFVECRCLFCLAGLFQHSPCFAVVSKDAVKLALSHLVVRRMQLRAYERIGIGHVLDEVFFAEQLTSAQVRKVHLVSALAQLFFVVFKCIHKLNLICSITDFPLLFFQLKPILFLKQI